MPQASDAPPPRRWSPVQAVIGLVMIVLGVLMVGGASLCSALFLADDWAGDAFFLALIFGGPFIVIGLLLVWGGLALWRRRTE